jgi:hypothetical protein
MSRITDAANLLRSPLPVFEYLFDSFLVKIPASFIRAFDLLRPLAISP